MAPSSDPKAAAERSKIDASARGPVMFFLFSGLLWLLVATVLQLVSTIQIGSPEFLANCPWCTFGRVTPAFLIAFKYGWASMAGMGIAVWLMARLCRVTISFPWILTLGAGLWNLGVTLGLIAILAGQSTGLEGMELPMGCAWLMFAGYLFIGLWGMIAWRHRRQLPVYISVWYLLGAFFWFPWAFATSHLLIGTGAVTGVMQNVVAAFLTNSLHYYWFIAIALAVAYYLIPKVCNRPIVSYHLASVGFWTFAAFAGLTSAVRLSGGPVPAWLVSLSIAASIMMIVPLITVSTNLWLTLRQRTDLVLSSPTIRFTSVSVIFFVIGSLLSVISAFRSVDKVLHFTPYAMAQHEIMLYGFFSMVLFGAIYYVAPRLMGCEWLSSTFIRWHFRGSAYGGGMLCAMYLFAAVAMGMALDNGEQVFGQVITASQFYIPGAVIAQVLMAIGHTVFAFHFLLMWARIGQPAGEPTLLSHGEQH